MTPGQARRAAELLLAARREGRAIETLPPDCRPVDLDEGYRIQDAFVALSGKAVSGFKIGATSDRAQAYLEINVPFTGCVLQGDLYQSPARLPAGDFIFRLIEPEFAFRLGRDLPSRDAAYDRLEVADAVESLHPAIEIVTSGLQDWRRQGAAALVADNGVDGGLVLGPACAEWRGLDLPGHAVSLAVNGAQAGSGVGANALGDPLIALAWLAGDLSRRGRGLEAGQVVTTGVVTPFVELQAGDSAVADFGTLGEVQLTFDA
jgi:2-keto-4-pentenoate hydratase